MTKNTLLVIVLLVLAAVYAVFFTNWFKARTVRVFSLELPAQEHAAYHAPIIFGLIGKYRLTDVKVVPLLDYEKNPMTPPLWHLVSDSNSIPVERFKYGQYIHGMRPDVKGEEPQDLDSNVTYRLFVAAGSLKGSHDFKIK